MNENKFKDIASYGIAFILGVLIICVTLECCTLGRYQYASGGYGSTLQTTRGTLIRFNEDKEQLVVSDVEGAGMRDGNAVDGTIVFSCSSSESFQENSGSSTLFQEIMKTIPVGSRVEITHFPRLSVASTDGELCCDAICIIEDGGWAKS